MKDTLTQKDTRMVLSKLVANEQCTWSFEEVVHALQELDYRQAESQVRPFLLKLRTMKQWHALSMFADRFAGQYKSIKDDARQLIGSLDNLRDNVTRNVKVLD